MGASLEEEWSRLLRHLEFSDGFWFAAVSTASPPAAAELLARATNVLREGGRAVLRLSPKDADALMAVLDVPDRDDAREAGLVWVEAIHGGDAWRDAWGSFLLRANERRDRWRRRMRGGLVFAGPPELKVLAREAAPDLWSVRALSLEPNAPDAANAAPRRDRDEAPRPADRAASSVNTDDLIAEAIALEGARHPRAAAVMVDCASALARQGHPHEAVEWMERAGAYADGQAPPRMRALAWGDIARAEEDDRDAAGAQAHYERAIALWDGADGTSLAWMDDVAALAMRRLDLALASTWAERMEAGARWLATARPEEVSAKQWLARARERRGDVWEAQGELLAAGDAYAEALRVRRELARGDEHNAGFRRDLSVSLEKVGDARRSQGDLSGATAAYEESLALRRSLLDGAPEAPAALRDLSAALERMGDVRRDRGDLAGAGAMYSESLAIRRRVLGARGEAADDLRALSSALNNVGDVRADEGDGEAAEHAYRESLETTRRLLARSGDNSRSLRDLSLVLERFGDARRGRGDLSGAMTSYEESRALRRQLLDVLGRSPRTLRDLAVIQEKVGEARRAQGELQEADEALGAALSLRREWAEALGDAVPALRELADCLEKAADVRQARGDLAGAAGARQEALLLRRRWRAATEDSPAAVRALAATLEGVGDVRRACADFSGAVGAYEEALQQMRTLADMLGTSAGPEEHARAALTKKLEGVRQELPRPRPTPESGEKNGWGRRAWVLAAAALIALVALVAFAFHTLREARLRRAQEQAAVREALRLAAARAERKRQAPEDARRALELATRGEDLGLALRLAISAADALPEQEDYQNRITPALKEALRAVAQVATSGEGLRGLAPIDGTRRLLLWDRSAGFAEFDPGDASVTSGTEAILRFTLSSLNGAESLDPAGRFVVGWQGTRDDPRLTFFRLRGARFEGYPVLPPPGEKWQWDASTTYPCGDGTYAVAVDRAAPARRGAWWPRRFYSVTPLVAPTGISVRVSTTATEGLYPEAACPRDRLARGRYMFAASFLYGPPRAPISMVDVESGYRFPPAPSSSVFFALSPSGEHLLASSHSAPDATRIYSRAGSSPTVRRAAVMDNVIFTPGERQLVVCYAAPNLRMIELWRLDRSEALQGIVPHRSPFLMVDHAALGGFWTASGGFLRLWDYDLRVRAVYWRSRRGAGRRVIAPATAALSLPDATQDESINNIMAQRPDAPGRSPAETWTLPRPTLLRLACHFLRFEPEYRDVQAICAPLVPPVAPWVEHAIEAVEAE